MLYLQSLVLGLVQGITEFFPISSSAHLVIVPYLFHWVYQGLVYDVALHFGTLIAIILFFWRDWVDIIDSAFSPSRHCEESSTRQSPANAGPTFVGDSSQAQNDKNEYPKGLLWMLLVGTIPGGIAGVLLEKQAENAFRSPLVIAINLLVFGLIIYLSDRYSKKELPLTKITYKNALLVGLAQMLAIVPGVSRSGSTMAAGRAIGLKREVAARFSFLLAAPIMLGSTLYEARHFTSDMFSIHFALAFLTSLIFGWLAIKYLLKYLQRGNFAIFAWYRAALALVVIAVYFLR
jgi:undecaprenyl-diphosphatase